MYYLNQKKCLNFALEFYHYNHADSSDYHTESKTLIVLNIMLINAFSAQRVLGASHLLP